jgi:exonuclease III
MVEKILVWNVKGLNARAHCNAVRELVDAERVSLVCFQETKLESITDFDVIQLVGTDFDYVFLPAVQTRGGILVAWRDNAWVTFGSSSRLFLVSIRLRQVSDMSEWWLTTVYGPSRDEDKPSFLAELHDLRQVRTSLWLLVGDFNMIYHAQDKNNDRDKRRLMGSVLPFLERGFPSRGSPQWETIHMEQRVGAPHPGAH